MVSDRAYQAAKNVFFHNKSAPVRLISSETNQRTGRKSILMVLLIQKQQPVAGT